jgi:MFS family permease
MTHPADDNLVLPPLRLRLIVLGFVCTLALITYLDRVCISRVQEDIQRELVISPEQMGWVFTAFLLGYGLFEVPGGWLGDRWGVRWVLAGIVIWWSVCTALTGYVWPFQITGGSGWVIFDSLMLLLLIRFVFGAGEAGAFPNLSRVVKVWFSFRERAFALGAIWFSARLGGAVAPGNRPSHRQPAAAGVCRPTA